MRRPLTVLIVGGYGTFGGRLAHLVGDLKGLTLLISGRSLARAEQFCASPRESAGREAGYTEAHEADSAAPPVCAVLRPVQFNRDAEVETQLRSLAPDVVVDASGPFQSYGERPYRLVEACIECGVHYLDLADSAEFVCGIDRFDQSARVRGVFVLSGVSSFPVLTAAVVRLLSDDLTGAERIHVDRITAGIAPSPFANVGLNVIRAIAGYAGKPVRLRDGDGFRAGYALTETVRYAIAAPGRVPLRSITFSLVDVPDSRLLADLWPGCQSVWIGAGPVPAIWHGVLRAFAWLVRIRVLPSLSFLAPLMFRAINSLSWGEHRGGMFVRVEGHDATGAPVDRAWHLVAEGEAGPFIPSMAAEAVIRKFIAGIEPQPGARPAVRELEVSDYEPLLARHGTTFGIHDDTRASFQRWPLYHRVLGSAWGQLPEPLQVMHSVHAAQPAALSRVARGRAEVTRGKGGLASLVASIIGFPKPGKDVPVEVRFDMRSRPCDPRNPLLADSLSDGRHIAPSPFTVAKATEENVIEVWTRTFAGRAFKSEQFAGTGRYDRLLCERFGPITLGLALVVEHQRLRLVVRAWSFLGIPLPRSLAPQCDAYEFEQAGFFHFNVALSHPLTGLIVHYRGWLVPATELPRTR